MSETHRRRSEILDLLKTNSIMTIEEISNQVFASISTIRRDLIYLDKEHSSITRIRGGAAYVKDPEEVFFMHRVNVNTAEKLAISKSAIKLVKEGQMIFMDSSTTCLHLANLLQKKMQNITILSNGFKANESLSKNSEIMTIATGGNVNYNSLTMVGQNAIETISNYLADTVFLSGKGLNEFGLLENSSEEAFVKNTFVKHALKVVVLIDSSKFVTTAKKICVKLSEIDCIITDKEPPDNIIESLRINNVELLIAEIEV